MASSFLRRLEQLEAERQRQNPPRQLVFDVNDIYGEPGFEYGEEPSEDQALDKLLAEGKVTADEREQARTGLLDILLIMRMIVHPVWDKDGFVSEGRGRGSGRPPPAYDPRPLLHATDLPTTPDTAEPRKRDPRVEERQPLIYPYRGDDKI
jgi:hypothetical protein